MQLKKIIILFVGLFISATGYSSNDELNRESLLSEEYLSLLSRYNEASRISNPQILLGGWVGKCFHSPLAISQMKKYGYGGWPKSAPTILYGIQSKQYVKAALLMLGYYGMGVGQNEEEEMINKYIDYIKNKRVDLINFVDTFNPLQFNGSDLSLDFIKNGINLQYQYRFDNDGLISVIKGNDTALPLSLQGIESICTWFKKIE